MYIWALGFIHNNGLLLQKSASTLPSMIPQQDNKSQQQPIGTRHPKCGKSWYSKCDKKKKKTLLLMMCFSCWTCPWIHLGNPEAASDCHTLVTWSSVLISFADVLQCNGHLCSIVGSPISDSRCQFNLFEPLWKLVVNWRLELFQIEWIISAKLGRENLRLKLPTPNISSAMCNVHLFNNGLFFFRQGALKSSEMAHIQAAIKTVALATDVIGRSTWLTDVE